MRTVTGLFLLLLLFALPIGAAAQDRAIHWERYDVAVDVEPDGDLRFTETHRLVVDRGTFRTGSRSFDTGEFGQVRDVRVSEDGQPYRRGTDQPGTYTASDNGNRFQLNYVFRDPNASSHNITVEYTVGRALVADSERARLEWNFFCATEGCPPIEAGAVSVRLPRVAAAPIEANAGGAPVRQTSSGDTVRWELTQPVQAQGLQLSVAFPRSLLAANAAFRSGARAETGPVPAEAVPETGPQPVPETGPQPVPGAAPVGFPFSPIFCMMVLVFLFIAFSIMRGSMRRQGYAPPRRRQMYPKNADVFGLPAPRRRRFWGRRGYGGWGGPAVPPIPPVIITPPFLPPFGSGEDRGGPFSPSPPQDMTPGGGGSSWGDSGGGGSSWGDSGGGGSSWGDAGGGGSSWGGDSGGGGSSWGGGGGGDSGGGGGGGGGNDSSSFG